LPVQSEQPMHLARQEGSQPPLYYLLAAAATFWIDTSDFPGSVWENPHYGYNVPGIVNDNKNLFIHTSLESFPYRGAVLAIHLARFVSVLMGAFAVLFTYRLALEIFRDQPLLAASAGASVAFVPQYIFISGAVSNDSTIGACAAFALWLIARHLTDERRPMIETIALGIACGLAASAKVSGAGLAVLAVLVLLYVSRGNAKLALLRLIVFGVAGFVVAGWWYLRNLLLYGELTGTAMMSRIFKVRETPLTLPELFVQLREVWETFWIGFGWGNIRAHPPVYTLIEVFLVLGLIGLFIGLIRQRDKSIRLSLAMLVAWVGLMFSALIYWMQSTQAPHGRLFFPALPAIAVLIVYGLDQLRIKSLRFVHFAFVALLFTLAALAPFAILQPAYAFPPSLNETQLPSTMRRVDIMYGDKMKLIGYEIAPRRALPGESVTLMLYWQSLVQMDEDYSIGMRVLDAKQNVIGARDSYPGHGMLPTRLWSVGQIIRDDYWLPINADATPGVAQIHVSLYQRESKRNLAAVDPNHQTITPIIGHLNIGAPTVTPPAQNPTNFIFGGQVALIGYDILRTMPEFELVLYWKRLAPVSDDYTVFVHVLNANKIIAQRDQMPGQSLTSLWDDGEVVIDRYLFTLTGDIAKQLAIGLYRTDTGERLPVIDGKGIEIGDSVKLSITRAP